MFLDELLRPSVRRVRLVLGLPGCRCVVVVGGNLLIRPPVLPWTDGRLERRRGCFSVPPSERGDHLMFLLLSSFLPLPDQTIPTIRSQSMTPLMVSPAVRPPVARCPLRPSGRVLFSRTAAMTVTAVSSTPSLLRGHSHMTSAKILGFLTPSISTK